MIITRIESHFTRNNMSVLIIIRSGPQYSLKCENFVNGLENLFLPANRL